VDRGGPTRKESTAKDQSARTSRTKDRRRGRTILLRHLKTTALGAPYHLICATLNWIGNDPTRPRANRSNSCSLGRSVDRRAPSTNGPTITRPARAIWRTRWPSRARPSVPFRHQPAGLRPPVSPQHPLGPVAAAPGERMPPGLHVARGTAVPFGQELVLPYPGLELLLRHGWRAFRQLGVGIPARQTLPADRRLRRYLRSEQHVWGFPARAPTHADSPRDQALRPGVRRGAAARRTPTPSGGSQTLP